MILPKPLRDLGSTRIQITYLIVGLFGWTIVKGIHLASTVADIAVLLGTLTPVFVSVAAWHLGGKWMDIKANEDVPKNGGPVPETPP